MLKNIYNKLNDIENSILPLYDVFKNNIFAEINLDPISTCVPLWIRDAGNSSECGLSKNDFERLVKNNNNELTHKLLYLYDCDMLVGALQDRFCMISSLIEKFYTRMPMKSSYKMTDFSSATMTMSSMDADLFAYLNSIFIFLGSSFDLITKISTELEQISLVDYSKYPKLKSKNILFGNRKYICNELKNDTIYNLSIIIKKIEAIRNRIVHDGSFDFRPAIYIGHINDHSENCIMFPDFTSGNFTSSSNRVNFYSESNRINIDLPSMMIETLQLIQNTINKIYDIYKKDKSSNEQYSISYKKAIIGWYKSYDCLKK